jgi:hypothetical protein
MAAATKTLYDTDFADWCALTAELVRAGRLDEVDLEHVAEEIEDMGKRDRRAATNRTRVLLLHLLQWGAPPEKRSPSWKATITGAAPLVERNIRELRQPPGVRPGPSLTMCVAGPRRERWRR